MSCFVSLMPSSGGSQWELIDGKWTSKKARIVTTYQDSSTAEEIISDVITWIDTTLHRDTFNEWMCIKSAITTGGSGYPGGVLTLNDLQISQCISAMQQQGSSILSGFAVTTGNIGLGGNYTAQSLYMQVIAASSENTLTLTKAVMYMSYSNGSDITCLYGRKV